MDTLFAWFRLIRPLNVLLIAVTPGILWLALIQPQLLNPRLSLYDAALLGVAIALVAAGGNIVNDIADKTIDRLNQRPNPLLGRLPTWVGWLTYLLSIAGATYFSYRLANRLGLAHYLWLLPLTVSLLFAYAFSLKCKPWIGNIVVALFCAGVPGILLLAEPELRSNYTDSPLSQSLLAYTGFAFFGTWAREVIKDLEDREGDGLVGCQTVAVSRPEEETIRLIYILLAFAVANVVYIGVMWWLQTQYLRSFVWLGLTTLLALIYFSLSSDNSKEQYGRVSTNLKYAIIFGLLALVAFGTSL